MSNAEICDISIFIANVFVFTYFIDESHKVVIASLLVGPVKHDSKIKPKFSVLPPHCALAEEDPFK